jgi:hypothetical protein
MSHEHVADIKRDAVALWLAVVNGDPEGAGVITGNTPCRGCLAMQCVVLGLAAFADEPYIGAGGNIAVPPAERERIAGLLASFRPDADGGAS